jgi:hypothetical protein
MIVLDADGDESENVRNVLCLYTWILLHSVQVCHSTRSCVVRFSMMLFALTKADSIVLALTEHGPHGTHGCHCHVHLRG